MQDTNDPTLPIDTQHDSTPISSTGDLQTDKDLGKHRKSQGFPLLKNIIKGAVFYDVGNVWSSVEDIFTSDDEVQGGAKHSSGFKQGAGVGVRVKTPIGPLKLDYGYPLSDNFEDEKEGQFYFSVSHGF